MTNSGSLIFFIFFVLKPTQDVVSDYLKEYIKLTQEPYFVDKTPLIDAVFHNDDHFSFISCPRLFGKSTNLKMIRSFAQMDMDVNGDPKMGENSTAFRIFRDLYITLYTHTFNKHFGKYATIYLNMNLDHVTNITDEYTLYSELYKRIRECYEDYKWVLDLTKEYVATGQKDAKIDLHLIEFMDKVFNESINEKQMEYALMQLVELVYGFFKKDILLLIDDYDSAAQNSIGIRDVNVLQVYRSIREMILRAFKYTSGKARPVKYAVITSIGGLNHEKFYFIDPISEKRIDTRYYPFLDDGKFAEYFGFTELDFEGLLKKYKYGEVTKMYMNTYYKGYRSRGLRNYVYNPYSMVNYLVCQEEGWVRKRLQNYWADAVSKRVLKKFIRVPSFREKLEELCYPNGSVEFTFDKHEDSKFSSFFYSMRGYNKDFIAKNVNELLKIFFQQGYLSHTDLDGKFVLPNLEIKNDLRVFLSENPPNFNDSEEFLKGKEEVWCF